MKRLSLAIICSILLASSSFSQKVIRLYDGIAPGSETWTQKESEFTHPLMTGLMVRNVVDPTLTVFKPKKANGTAIIVCPGGGYHWLSYESEGTQVAQWMADRGITAFVLKYRLVDTGPTMEDLQKAAEDLSRMVAESLKNSEKNDTGMTFPDKMMQIIPLANMDGIEAMKYVRQHAVEYKIDKDKIGMIGFSAGSGVELATVMKGDPESEPNFAGHIYGGDTRGEIVPENAPPLFILSAADDGIAASNPDLLKQWIEAGKSAELHIYSEGGHGFGMKKQNMPVDSWIERFGDWLKYKGFIAK